MFVRSAFAFWPFRRAKNAASKRKITASPLKLPGVTVKSADSLCAISVPFNNESREKAITISTALKRAVRLNRRFGRPKERLRVRLEVASASRLNLLLFARGEASIGHKASLEKSRIGFNADCVSAIFNP